MPLTLRERNRLVRAINRYMTASVQDSWKGGQRPEDFPRIEQELKRSKAGLDRILNELTLHEVHLQDSTKGL